MFRISEHKQFTRSRGSIAGDSVRSCPDVHQLAFQTQFPICNSILSHHDLLWIQHRQSMQISLLKFIDPWNTLYMYICWAVCFPMESEPWSSESTRRSSWSCHVTLPKYVSQVPHVVCPSRLWSCWGSSVLLSSGHLDSFRPCYLDVHHSISCMKSSQALVKH